MENGQGWADRGGAGSTTEGDLGRRITHRNGRLAAPGARRRTRRGRGRCIGTLRARRCARPQKSGLCCARPDDAIHVDEPHHLGQTRPGPVDLTLNRPDLGPQRLGGVLV